MDVAPPPIDPVLPFGDINVLVLTDIHSWLASHRRQEPHLDADLGNILSFWERLKAHCDENGMDLWFVMNGDWIDGTGLALNGDPSYILPLLQKMPWDAVNVSTGSCALPVANPTQPDLSLLMLSGCLTRTIFFKT